MTDGDMQAASAQPGGVSVVLRICGALIALLGLAMGAGGIWLLTLGGSPYNLIVGLLLTIAGGMMTAGARRGASLYLAVTLLICAWGLWDVGLNGWALVPRTGLPLLLLAIVGLAWPTLPDGQRDARSWGAVAVGVMGLVGLTFATMTVHITHTAWTPDKVLDVVPMNPSDDWTSYGRTLASTRFSPAAQITPSNVKQLKVAWTYHTGNLAAGVYQSLELTPLKVGHSLYLCTPLNVVIALDAATGQERWRFDPQVSSHSLPFVTCRGVSYYKVPDGAWGDPTAPCAERILVGTLDFRLIAVDAQTGQRCAGFGDNGEVNLAEGFGKFVPGFAVTTSPATIVNGVAVIGHMVLDNQRTDSPSGVIRGYDAVTGKLRWAWDTEHPDESTPPQPGQTYSADTPNAWTIFAGDEALGLVYVPTGGAPPDYFGGQRRPGDDKFGSSIVALDVATGHVKWSFQTVHHDIWDYDIASQPSLVDFPTEFGPVPALIQPTKTGQLFVLDRRDGHPLTPVEERPVPDMPTVPEDHASPTQPYSVGMPRVTDGVLSAKDMWGLTPIDQMICTIEFQASNYKGRYTPPSVKPFIQYPGYVGGYDWGSVAVDTSRNILIANSGALVNRNHLVPRAEVDRLGVGAMGDPGVDRLSPLVSPQKGTPYGVVAKIWFSPLMIPCNQPPWGTLQGIDLKTQKVIWSRPLGTTYDNGPWRIPLHIPAPAGVPNAGGSVVTASGLTFIAATADAFIRAFDTQTGEELWRDRLPAGGQATPMSYELDGRQYVVIAAGGQTLMQTAIGDSLVAYALPATTP